MRCRSKVLLMSFLVTLRCLAAEEGPKHLLFDVDELPRGRQDNCYEFFEERFGEHTNKEGGVARFDEGAVYHEFRDFRVKRKQQETGNVSWLRVRSVGRGGRPNLTEGNLKELEDTAHTLQTVEFTAYFAPDVMVKDVALFLSQSLGVDRYTSRDEERSGEQLLTDFLSNKDHCLLKVPEGANINFGKPRRLEADPKQPGLAVEVQVIVPR